MSSQVEFNANVYVSEQLNRQLVNMAQDLAHRCVSECAKMYGFEAEEAIRMLGLAMVKLERNKPQTKKVVMPKTSKTVLPKPAFPLPYSGEFKAECCYALRQNNGLYTQCQGIRKGSADFCKSCSTTMQKQGADIPEYGTIQQRMACEIMDYVDPKGRKPIAYGKIMKKNKLTEEQVEAEAEKFGLKIDPIHFAPLVEEGKRGRPKAEKEPKAKGTKGRPKKEKKLLLVEGDDDEDMFDTLVRAANQMAEPKKQPKLDEEKEAKKKAEEEARLAKKLAAEQAKLERELKLAAEKAEKEAKKKAEEEARLAKKLALEHEKAEKEAKKLAEKAEKEAKLAAEKAAKEAAKKPSKKAEVAEPEEEQEQERVKTVKFEGKKYLKSLSTGVIYDYIEWTQNGNQVVLGKWNEAEDKIVFDRKEDDEEEEEEEYDM